MMGATPPVTTTTLLLVLATTAALFFDLAAARCKVMMFMPGHLEPHETHLRLTGIVTEKSDDSSKIQVLDASYGEQPEYWPGSGEYDRHSLVHAVFGTKPTYKWYTAVKALHVVAKASAVIANDVDGNYYVFRGPTGTTITEPEWTGTVTLDPVGNGKPKEMAWIALVRFRATVGCYVFSVYINEEPSLRTGPMRYAGYRGKAYIASVAARSQDFFQIEDVTIDSGADGATNGRIFYGYGTFENAKVAMNVHFQVTGKAVPAGNAIVSAAGFVYYDLERGNKALTYKEATVVKNLAGDVHSLGWVAAYDPTLRKFVFYQKMAYVSDGFHNGKLTMGTSADATIVGLEGTIVFASRDDDKFTLYLPTFKAKAGQDAIRGFYGKKPWSAAMITALDGIGTTPADDTANEIYLSTTTFNADGETKITNGNVNNDPGLFEFDLKTGDTCGMVKWVAFRQTKGDKKYLAHRDMTKKM